MSQIERVEQRHTIWQDVDEAAPLWMWSIDPTAEDGFAAFAASWDAAIIEAASKPHVTD